MDNNIADSGSRVTRSLRKRLTSVDSDNSSRPGTPVISKLTSISEISSPSRSTRMTRRNSISSAATPGKTPVKRDTNSTTIAENSGVLTPARRSTRRRSASINETEDFSTSLKIPSFPALDEEIAEQVMKSTRVTRSQSKSPLNNSVKAYSPKKIKSPDESKNKNVKTEVPRKRKPGPKSKTRDHEEELEDHSDVEISVLENDTDHIINNFSNVSTIDLANDDSFQVGSTITNKDETKLNVEKHSLKVPQPSNSDAEQKNYKTDETIDKKLNHAEYEVSTAVPQLDMIKNVEENLHISNEINLQDKNDSVNDDAYVTKCDSINANLLNSKDHTTPDKKKEKLLLSDNFRIANCNILEDTITPEENILKDITTPEGTKTPEKVKIVVDITSKELVTPEVINEPDLSEGVEISITSFDHKADPKKVEFVSSPSNDMEIKNVYPKTPAPKKPTNSFNEIRDTTDDGSLQLNCSSPEINLGNHQNKSPKNEDNDNKSNNVVEETQIFDKNITPIRGLKCAQTLDKNEYSTAVNVELSVQIKGEEGLAKTSSNILQSSMHEQIERADKSTESTNILSDEDKDNISNHNNIELKWVNPCVKAMTADGSKLDEVTNTNYFHNNKDIVVNENQENKKKRINFLSEDEQEESEEENKEKSYKRDEDYHDFEAMEVNDYISGDSMEEKNEIEENEIPVNDESIGSQTTDSNHDEYVEEVDSEIADSFIVSDNEELSFSDSGDEDGDIESNYGKSKKLYKRIQLAESSSTEDNEGENENFNNNDTRKSLNKQDKNKHENVSKTTSFIKNSEAEKNNLVNESGNNTIIEPSKFTDNELELHYTGESECEEKNKPLDIIVSRKKILRNLNRSDRFNKSVADLDPEIDTSLSENTETSQMTDNNTNLVKPYKEENKSLISADKFANKKPNINIKQSDSNLGEVSVTSESDGDKENKIKESHLSHDRKSDSKPNAAYRDNKNVSGKSEWQRSFTIDVSVKHGELETAVTDVKLKRTVSSDYQENEKIKRNEEGYLETIRRMPLGNPLIRTRRQSLALPTNPDMEIGSSNPKGNKDKTTNRASLGLLSSIDFKPSQSFIDSIELQKSERNRNVAKRKRLSKSFCGAPESHENSVIDIDVCHLHKRSKLMDENSREETHHDSIENIDNKLLTKLSSTPYDKINKKYSDQRILTRCDEILEAANRAKFEDKLKNRKTKAKKSKKSKKKFLSTSDESTPDEMLRISKELKRRDETKVALSQAIMAADIILRKPENHHPNNQERQKFETRRLATDVVQAIGKSGHITKKKKNEKVYEQEKIKNIRKTSTSAGTFLELPQSPQKNRKKSTYIQLSTGKVSVEPITPKKVFVKTSKGMTFRESPVTPNAVGFQVEKISPLENTVSPSSIVKTGKRKRCQSKCFTNCSTSKTHWTQSGFFKEEDVTKKTHLWSGLQKQNNRQVGKEAHNVNFNFKEESIMRPEIRRSNKREQLLLKKRR